MKTRKEVEEQLARAMAAYVLFFVDQQRERREQRESDLIDRLYGRRDGR